MRPHPAPLVLAAVSALAPLASRATAQSWQRIFNGEVRDAFVHDDGHGTLQVWTCEDGSRIRYWTTGQTGWTFQDVAETATQALLDIFVRDGTEGWACGHAGTVLGSSSAAGPWDQKDEVLAGSEPAILWSIRFTSSTDGWLAGERVLRATTTGGVAVGAQPAWEPVDIQSGAYAEDDFEFYGLEFVPGESLRFVVGAEPSPGTSIGESKIFYSDGGANFVEAEIQDVSGSPMDLDEEFEPWDFVFEPHTGSVKTAVGYFVGGIGAHDGHIFRTTNGGATWREEVVNDAFTGIGPETFYGAHAWSGGNGLACGYGGHVYKRNTSTGEWSRVHPSSTTPNPCSGSTNFTAPLNGIAGDDSGTLWVVGSFGSLRNSTDGGTTLDQEPENGSDPETGGQLWRFNDSHLASSSLGWVVGQAGIQRMDVASGVTSFTQETCTFGDTWLLGVAMAPSGLGVAVGDPGGSGDPNVWVRNPSTSTWSSVSISSMPYTGTLVDVVWTSGSTFWAFAHDAVLRNVDVGGTNDQWDLLTFVPDDSGTSGTPSLNAAAFVANAQIFVVGSEGSVARGWRSTSLTASNPGWDAIPSTVGSNLTSIASRGTLPGVEVYACGADGVVVKWKRTADEFQVPDDTPPSTGQPLRSVALPPSSSDVWVGGDFGTMLRFDGSDWSTVKCQTSKSVHGLSFASSSAGLGLGGQNGISLPGVTGDSVVIGYR